MALARFYKLDDTKKRLILESALREFAVSEDYEQASVNRIIERAGISKGAMYYYFADKSDLFATVLNHSLEQLMHEVKFPKSDELTLKNYWSSMDETMTAMMRFNLEQQDHMKLWRHFSMGHGMAQSCGGGEQEPQGELGRLFVKIRGLIKGPIVRGQELGLIREDLPLELLMDVMLSADMAFDRWVYSVIDTMEPEQLLRYAQAHSNTIRRILER